MSPYEVLMNAPQPWSEISPEEWLDMHRLRPQEHRLAAVRVRIAELRALNWNTELSQLEKYGIGFKGGFGTRNHGL